MKTLTRLVTAGAALLVAASASAQTVEWTFNNNYAPTRVGPHP